MSMTHPTWTRRGLRFFLLWPVLLAWRMASVVERGTGIVWTLIGGSALVMLGLFLCSTLLGVILGLPMAICGSFLLARALY